MTTRKEDAASIIGEELAEEIEQKSALVGKSEALIIKSESEEETKEEMGVTMSEVVTLEPVVTLSDVMGKISELSTSISGLVDILSAKAKDEKKPMPEDEEETDEEDEKEEEDYEKKKAEVETKSAIENLVVALSEAMQPTNQKLDIMIAALSANKSGVVAPERRSISPADVARSMVQRDPAQPLSFAEVAKKSVGL